MGDQFTAADVVTGSGLRWGMGFGMIPKRPALVEYVGRLSAREAFKRAVEKDDVGSKDESRIWLALSGYACCLLSDQGHTAPAASPETPHRMQDVVDSLSRGDVLVGRSVHRRRRARRSSGAWRRMVVRKE
jgi:hypothetical protein